MAFVGVIQICGEQVRRWKIFFAKKMFLFVHIYCEEEEEDNAIVGSVSLSRKIHFFYLFFYLVSIVGNITKTQVSFSFISSLSFFFSLSLGKEQRNNMEDNLTNLSQGQMN